MSNTHEFVIASELLLYPANAGTAAEILRSNDFFEPRCRLAFDGVTALWRRYPTLTPDDALEMVVRLAERRHGASREEGIGCAEWVMDQAEATLYDEMVPDQPRPFVDRCRILADDNTIHRLRDKLGRWYITLFTAHRTGAGTYIGAGGRTAQKLAEELLADIQGEMHA